MKDLISDFLHLLLDAVLFLIGGLFGLIWKGLKLIFKFLKWVFVSFFFEEDTKPKANYYKRRRRSY